MSVNASQGTVAVFNCTAYSQISFWSVNKKLLDHADNLHRGLIWNDTTLDPATNLRIHLLLIPAQLMNDGVDITCTIYNFGTDPVTSNPVYLYIQGIYIYIYI